MVYRYSWVVGAGASILAFSMLNSLLKSTTEGLAWQVVVGGGLILGIVISWTTAVYRIRSSITVLIHVLLMAIVAMRIAAPETMVAIFPTGETFAEMRELLKQALDVIQNGVEPVIPVTGLVVIVTLVFWGVGALLSWGLSTGHPFVALLPPFVLTLQFATMDRQPTSILRIAAFVVLAILAILAVTRDEEGGSGRMYRRSDGAASRRSVAPAGGALAVTVIASLVSVTLFASVVPRDGVLDWRNPTGLTGDYFGSISYNPFIGIRQSLVSPTNQVVFTARIEGEADPSDVYFRLVTMDTYSGGRFFADDPLVVTIDQNPWEWRENAFFGPSDKSVTTVTIGALAQDWLPAAYAPIAADGSDQLLANLQIRPDDASIHLDGGRSFEGLTYTIDSEIPRPDLSVLATGEDGSLSVAFQMALDGDEAVPEPVATEWRPEPALPERYLALPDYDAVNRLGEVASLSREITANLETPFEKGLALETWFHTPFTGSGERTDGFVYTTNIQPGYGATDLAAWLLDEDSPNHHKGYCENFATAMAVMARSLGIPSRVVLGFTPGIRSPQDPELVVVTDRNAHAWVELWMPNQGWVRFDPTPRSAGDTPQTFEYVEDQLGFSMVEYLDVPDPATLDGGGGGRPPELGEFDNPDGRAPLGGGSDSDGGGLALPAWLPQLLWVLVAGAAIFGSLPLVKWVGKRRRLRRLRAGDVSAAWEQIVSRLIDLGERPAPTATAREVAEDFDPVLAPLASAYERSIYGPQGSVGDAHVVAAVTTLERTEDVLATRYSRTERLKAVYRPGTISPKWWRRLRNR